MKKIKLTQGKFALVDDDDYKELSKWNWCVYNCGKSSHTYYAKRKQNGKTILMHRQILGVTDRSKLVDHKDHLGYNNQRSNLRIVTPSQNQMNRGYKKKEASSKYIGVSFCKERRKYIASITLNGRLKNLGRYLSEDEAAIVYNIAAKKHFKEFAMLNKIK